jgi:hypothetical protein
MVISGTMIFVFLNNFLIFIGIKHITIVIVYFINDHMGNSCDFGKIQ